MSHESAKAFLDKMKSDEGFRKKVIECKDNEERKGLVKKEGFDFTLDELKTHTGELSEEQLSSISAGGSGCWEQCYIPHSHAGL